MKLSFGKKKILSKPESKEGIKWRTGEGRSIRKTYFEKNK